jgi:hypothetical protein
MAINLAKCRCDCLNCPAYKENGRRKHNDQLIKYEQTTVVNYKLLQDLTMLNKKEINLS